jgi:hypothetical protein
VSHAAVYSEVLFGFLVVLTLLLTLIGVVVRTPPGTVGPRQPAELSSPPPPQPVRGPQHAGAPKPELVAAGRLQVPGGPPWGPAPKPPGPRPSPFAKSTSCAAGMNGPDPGRRRSAQVTAVSTASGVRAGAHRRVRRQGAHRAGIGTGHARSAAGRTGRHRAGVH